MNASDPDQLVTGPLPAGPVKRGETPPPGTALVFSLNTGEAVTVDRKPSFLEATRFHNRYEVDITDHHAGWSGPLPSRTTGFAFRAEISTTWRITSPEVVVKRGVTTLTTAEALVHGALNEQLRPHTRSFDIEDVGRAEDSVNRFLRSRQRVLDAGLTILDCVVRLSLDETAESYLRNQRDLAWQKQQARLAHGVTLAQAEGAEELTSLAEEHEARRVRERTAALQAAQRGEGGLLVHLIAQDPSQLRSILQEIAGRQDMTLERKQALLRDFKDELHPAERAEWVQRFMGEPLPYAGPALEGASPHPGSRAPIPPPPRHRDDRPSRPEPVTGAGGPTAEEQPGNGVVGWKPVGRNRTRADGAGRQEREDERG
ncbi:hypothetical protein ACFVU3_26770 [Streptomyces sp. NPDC058052]|uniref:hypothetical protein n=1 Tax=Streptomyces sp. NPDC058052 TaxID=3346316 RepID=UPI0036E4C639